METGQCYITLLACQCKEMSLVLAHVFDILCYLVAQTGVSFQKLFDVFILFVTVDDCQREILLESAHLFAQDGDFDLLVLQ